jgi:NACHT domain
MVLSLCSSLILAIHQKINSVKLPSAKGAAFDSHLDEHDARCLSNTRVELRRHILEWAEDSQAKCIFWLNGMAGTGKSTISRTIAQSFADKGQLGASFFFKRGEGNRGNATRFLTTIAAQLATKIPDLVVFIGNAVDADPNISEKALKEQFEKLIFQPLSRIQSASLLASRTIIVIDALDECERDEDIETIIILLSQLRDVKSICVRVFLTSRPELPIRLGFKNMKGDTYQDLVLHEMSQITIERDICAFVEHEMSSIRVRRSLAMDWPRQEDIQAIVNMAAPLFIFAATVCRFIGDPRWDPKRRLATILEYQTASQASKLDKTYLPVLDQLLVGQDKLEKEKLVGEFQEVVGAIVVLTSPLSTISLSNLLDISQDDVNCRLDLLHSVLSIPTNQTHPVRLLHLSFREFLLDPLKSENNPFWIDERKTHEKLASKCLQLISRHLKQNICNLRSPGTLRTEINQQTIDVYLPTEVQYACRYWVHHLEQSKTNISDYDEVHIFLEEHLLYWLEALTLLGNLSQSITMFNILFSMVDVRQYFILARESIVIYK